MSKFKIRRLTVSAVFIALATVLSFVKFQLPVNIHGGSITLLSMLPVAMLSVCYGTKWGICSAFAYSLIQLFFGITLDGVLGWGLSAAVLVGTIVLDYLLAFTVIGLSGIFAGYGLFGTEVGISLAITLRFLCHFVSGIVLFGEFAQSSTWIYSLTYNGSYMLPELVLTVAASSVLFGLPQIKRLIKRISSGSDKL